MTKPTHSQRFHGQSKSRRVRPRRIGRFETLEKRRLLAVDFVANYPERALELEQDNTEIVVFDVTAGQTPLEILRAPVAEIDSKVVEIRAASLLIDSNIALGGNRLDVSAGSIVIDGATLNSQDSIALNAVDRPGVLDYLFDDASSPVSFASGAASIELRDSVITASEVTIAADGSTQTSWDDVAGYQDQIAGPLLEQLNQIDQIGISSISPLSGQVKVHAATSSIIVDHTTIVSDGGVTLDANAQADASLTAIAVSAADASVLAAVGFSHSVSSATIGLTGGTTVTAGGDVLIGTFASSQAETVSRAEANSRLTPSTDVSTAFNMSLALTDETSTIALDSSVVINAVGSVDVHADAEVVNQVKSSTAIFKDGNAGFAVAVGVDNATVTADVAATISSDASASGQAGANLSSRGRRE